MGRAVIVVACAGVLVGVGCSERLLRETVFANTESVVGVSIAQDARTQGYAFSAGYTRSEVLLVPTDKVVAGEGESGGATVAQGAERTADVLAEIQVGGEGRAVAGGPCGRVELYQRLAVGPRAVSSGAAIALMSPDVKTARAVSAGLRAKDVTPARAELLSQVELLRRATGEGSVVEIDGEARAFADGRALGDHLARELSTEAQREGNWDLRNFRAKASDAQLRDLVAMWTGLLTIGEADDE